MSRFGTGALPKHAVGTVQRRGASRVGTLRFCPRLRNFGVTNLNGGDGQRVGRCQVGSVTRHCDCGNLRHNKFDTPRVRRRPRPGHQHISNFRDARFDSVLDCRIRSVVSDSSCRVSTNRQGERSTRRRTDIHFDNLRPVLLKFEARIVQHVWATKHKIAKRARLRRIVVWVDDGPVEHRRHIRTRNSGSRRFRQGKIDPLRQKLVDNRGAVVHAYQRPDSVRNDVGQPDIVGRNSDLSAGEIVQFDRPVPRRNRNVCDYPFERCRPGECPRLKPQTSHIRQPICPATTQRYSPKR